MITHGAITRKWMPLIELVFVGMIRFVQRRMARWVTLLSLPGDAREGGGTGETVAYRAHQADVSEDDDEHQVDLACHLGLHRPAYRAVLFKTL